MTDEKEKNYVPLTMHDQVIGKIHFDFKTGEISGFLYDPEMKEMLDVLFTEGLMEVSFLGKPSMPLPEAVELLRHFREQNEEKKMSDSQEVPPAVELGHPEPPHETELGKDSVSADEVAQTQEDGLKAEELATDE